MHCHPLCFSNIVLCTIGSRIIPRAETVSLFSFFLFLVQLPSQMAADETAPQNKRNILLQALKELSFLMSVRDCCTQHHCMSNLARCLTSISSAMRETVFSFFPLIHNNLLCLFRIQDEVTVPTPCHKVIQQFPAVSLLSTTWMSHHRRAMCSIVCHLDNNPLVEAFIFVTWLGTCFPLS